MHLLVAADEVLKTVVIGNIVTGIKYFLRIRAENGVARLSVTRFGGVV